MDLAMIPEKIGPYCIEARLGAGGMGAVYRAYDERLDRRVALKQIRPDKVLRKNVRERFLREARIAARLNHPALVHVHDFLEEAGSDWIVMELVEGTPLAHLLDAGPLPLHQTLPLASAIASGLAAAHAAGILHRDLKSENVIVTAGGGAKILDFGLAKPLEPDGSDLSMTSEGGILGTPRAMSPEQAQSRDVDHRSDLFSLGTLLYEMLTGHSPFKGPGPLETMHRICHEPHEPVSEHAPEVPAELSSLVDRLLAKVVAERPASAQEVVAALDHVALFVKGAQTIDEANTEIESVSGVAEEHAQPPKSGPSRALQPQSVGERRQLTVLCSELVGADESSGSLDPEVLYEVLPAFQNFVGQALARYGGHLADVQSHRLVIYFGYPLSHEDNARRAVLTALEIVAKSERLAERLEGSSLLAARAGIHTGPAVVLAGAREHLALGGTLDLATGLAEQATAGGVLVSALTHRLIEGFFVEREVGPLRVTGFEDPLPVYRVESTRGVHSRVEGTAMLPPMAGREHELAFLVDRFQLAREGSGQALLLSGKAGMGKSRLVRALREQLAKEGLWWLCGYGDPYARHLPLLPVSGLLLQLLACAPQDSPAQQQTQLEEVLREHGLPTAKVASSLMALLELSATEGKTLASESRRVVADLFPELLLELVEQRGEKQQATVLIFESLQWLDSATLELVGQLIDRSAAAPILLLLTCRPGFQTPWGHSHLTRLHLNPLDSQQAETLVDSLAGKGALAGKTRKNIVHRALGVPLYVEELTRDALETPEVAPGVALPATLLDPLTTQLDCLGTARDVAQLAAALDREFSRRELLSLWPLEASLDHEIERLLAAEIVVQASSPRRFRFQQPLVREAVLASLLAEDRARLERQVTTLRGREDTS